MSSTKSPYPIPTHIPLTSPCVGPQHAYELLLWLFYGRTNNNNNKMRLWELCFTVAIDITNSTSQLTALSIVLNLLLNSFSTCFIFSHFATTSSNNSSKFKTSNRSLLPLETVRLHSGEPTSVQTVLALMDSIISNSLVNLLEIRFVLPKTISTILVGTRITKWFSRLFLPCLSRTTSKHDFFLFHSQ